MLHAQARCPEVINLALRQYAVRYVVHIHKTMPSQDDGDFRLELFTGVVCGTKMKENHTFGYPVFALQNDLQDGDTIPKWSTCSRLGVNIGPFLLHDCKW